MKEWPCRKWSYLFLTKDCEFFVNAETWIVCGLFCRLSKVVLQVTKKQSFPSHVKSLVLEICCNDTEGEDVEVPYIKYNLPLAKS
jgi:hypothetical protein